MVASNGNQPAGPAADAQGRTAIDPTENVKAILDAAVRRQDDLRDMAQTCNTEITTLRAYYEDKLREAEAKRLDAIRAVDVGNVDRAAKEAIERANTLAGQVTTTATAFDSKLAAALDPIIKDIADLRRVQYEGVGQKTQVVEGRDSGRYTATLIGAALGLIGIVTFLLSLKK